MKTLATVSCFLLSLAASAAYATNPGDNGSMDLAGLKAKCAELTANQQLKPFKAVVTCSQVSMVWRPSTQTADSVKIQNTKEIGASFTLKGYAVPFQAEQVKVDPAESPCSLLEQFKVSVPAVDVELDCAALDKVENIVDLCGPAIDERVTADPSIQVEESTGKTFNTCTDRPSR